MDNFLFKYFYKIKFQGDFKSQALNPHFKDKMFIAPCWKRDLEEGDMLGISKERCVLQERVLLSFVF